MVVDLSIVLFCQRLEAISRYRLKSITGSLRLELGHRVLIRRRLAHGELLLAEHGMRHLVCIVARVGSAPT